MSPLRRTSPAGPRPLSCRQVARILQSYLDGEADDLFAAKVAEHLEDCRRCGLEADVYLQIKASLARQGGSVPVMARSRLRRFSEELMSTGSDGDGSEAG